MNTTLTTLVSDLQRFANTSHAFGKDDDKRSYNHGISIVTIAFNMSKTTDEALTQALSDLHEYRSKMSDPTWASKAMINRVTTMMNQRATVTVTAS